MAKGGVAAVTNDDLHKQLIIIRCNLAKFGWDMTLTMADSDNG
jgi:hypothetical protein